MKSEEKVVSLLDTEHYGEERVVSLEDLRDIYSSQYKWIVLFADGTDCCLIDYDWKKESSTVYSIDLVTGEKLVTLEMTDIIRVLEECYEVSEPDNFFIIATKTREDAEFFIKDFKSWNEYVRRKETK